MFRAALFDMDGLMVNTEPLQSLAFERVIRQYGKQPILNDAGLVQMVGLREKDNWEHIKTKHGLTESIATLTRQRRNEYLKALQVNVAAQPGLLALLDLLRQHNIRMAVASSSVTELIDVVLQALHIADYFEVVVSGQDVVFGKPAPDIFLLAAKRLKVRPEYCIIFEDAESGVRAGKAAGGKVIAVPNAYTKGHDYSLADITVASLANATWDALVRL